MGWDGRHTSGPCRATAGNLAGSRAVDGHPPRVPVTHGAETEQEGHAELSGGSAAGHRLLESTGGA